MWITILVFITDDQRYCILQPPESYFLKKNEFAGPKEPNTNSYIFPIIINALQSPDSNFLIT